MQELIGKIRQINYCIQDYYAFRQDYTAITEILSEFLKGNVYLVAKQGELLGAVTVMVSHSFCSPVLQAGDILPQDQNQELLAVTETTVNNTNLDTEVSYRLVIPVLGGNERVATFIVTGSSPFTEQDIIIAEYTATIVGVGIVRFRSDRVEEKIRMQTQCQMAVRSLSFSEQTAIHAILADLSGDEGIIITSKVAEKVGITRSIVVNGLRKLESGGLIETKSLGMKGTYVRVLNGFFQHELEKAL